MFYAFLGILASALGLLSAFCAGYQKAERDIRAADPDYDPEDG